MCEKHCRYSVCSNGLLAEVGLKLVGEKSCFSDMSQMQDVREMRGAVVQECGVIVF